MNWPAPPRLIDGCLLVLAASLLAVGVVSGTLVRHSVQVVPLLLAALFARRRPGEGPAATLPLFLFWMVLMVLIWLFLAGISSFAHGHYTPVEIILSVIMAAAGGAGALHAAREVYPRPWLPSAIVFLAFGGLQVIAMWVSFRVRELG